MGRLEVSCRRFAILSGIEQDPGEYAICVQPSVPGLQRKGTLAIITEPAGSLDVEACKLSQRVIIDSYFSDSALSLTTSLLNALDHANTALLQYNYSPPATPSDGEGEAPVQSSPTRSRRARIGATAVLIRPDGAGIYLSQMSPTQAYVFHNGLLSAIPEPSTWKQAPQHSVAVLSSAQSGGATGLEDEQALEDLAGTALPSPSLGAGPGIEADLVYRRVEAGDMVVLVSTSLARHLDRERAERIISRYDADGVIHSLYTIATENGLAEAHACVLELGVTDSSGVDEDYELPKAAPSSAAPEADAATAQGSPQRAPILTLKEVFSAPRDWFQRRKLEPEKSIDAPAEVEIAQGASALESPVEDATLDAAEPVSKQPTILFPQRPIDLPPYKAAQQQAAQDNSPGEWGDWSDEELQFDGWEDSPPALDDPRYDPSQVIFKPRSYDQAADDPHILGEEKLEPLASQNHGQQSLFDSAEADPHYGANPGSANTSSASKFDIRGMAGSAGAWLLTTTRSLLPDQISTGLLTVRGKQSSKSISLKLVIVAALVIAAILFVYSVMSMAGNNRTAATRNSLQEAQQMETLANQPGLLAADRLQKLQLALAKAQEAVAANPQSAEAALLATKVQNEIDQVQGITRFGSVKPLFDLDAATTAGASAAAPAQAPVSSTLPLPINDIIVQSNDAFILDRSTNKLYRCQIAAATCSVLLSPGDSAGGKQVGTLVAITMRVGNLVALDDQLVSYVLSADTGAWQAEALGDAASLQMPKDIATYDGNLYLLGSKPGQISKYLAGQYSQPPLDWIKDQSTVDAMKAPVAMAIDGEIYVALADGKILTMQGGALDKTLTPKAAPNQSPPTRLFTNTDVQDLYLIRAEDGTITRISKDGQTKSTLKAPAGMGLDKLSGMTVDEAKGKYYLVHGRQVYEATLAAPSSGKTTSPSASPTVAP